MMTENLSLVSLLDKVASPILICEDHTILFANQAAEKLLGYSNQELQQRSIESLVYVTSSKGFAKWYKQRLASKGKKSLDAQFMYAHESLMWVKLTTSAAIFEGKPAQIITLQDITQTRQTEAELYVSKAYRDMLMTNNPDVVMMIDGKGNLSYVSPSIKKALGYTTDEVMGQNWFDKIHPDDQPNAARASREARQTQKSVHVEARVRNHLGEYLWFEGVVGIVFQQDNDETVVMSTIRNIHKYKLTELALREREQRIRLIADNMSDIVLEIASDGIIRYISPSCFWTMGYQQEDLIGRSHLEQVHPDDAPAVLEYFSQALLAPSRAPLELRFKHKNGQYLWLEVIQKLVMDETGHVQSMVISAREITERKQTQVALQQSQHLLQQIMETAPTGIYLFDEQAAHSIFYNQKSVLGYSEAEIKQDGKNFFQNRVHPDDLPTFIDARTRVQQSKDGEVIISECRMKQPNGDWRWIQYHDTVFNRNETGRPTQYLRTSYDITERKRAEQELHQSQNMLKKITDTAPFGIYIYDVKKHRDIYHNKRLTEDINPEEIVETPEEEFYTAYVHPDDLQIHADHRKRIMEAPDGEIIESEVRARNRQGVYEWLYFRDIVFARDEEGKPTQFLGSMQDITQRKEAEQALRESQKLLQQIMETFPLDIYIYDVDLKRNVFFNRAENMGYPLEYLNSRPSGDFFATLVHPDDLPVHQTNVKHLMTARDGELLHNEYRMKHASGEWRWYDFRDIVFARHADGTPRQFLGSIQDITDRKTIEEALRQSQTVLQQVTSTVPMDIYIFDIGLNKTIFTNRANNLGLDINATMDSGDQFFRTLVHPDDVSLYDDFGRRLSESTSGTFVEGEFRMRHTDGRWLWRNYRNTVLNRNADGTPAQYLGTVEDVTPRKAIEEALRQSQHLFQQVAETVPMQIFIYDLDLQRNTFENRPSDLGFDDETLLHASNDFFRELIHPDDRPKHDEIMKKLLEAADGEMLELEFRMRSADGSYAWWNYRYTPFDRHPDGTLSKFLGTMLNVNERKTVSDALRENEEKLRMITDNIHDLVVLTDTTMHYRYATPSHERILGYKPGELQGISIFELVHPDDLDMVKSKIETAIEKKQGDSAEFRFRHRDGYYLWLETNGSLAIGDDGHISGGIFASRDVSERRWMQRAMLEQEKLLVMLQKEQELSSLKTRMMSRLSHELRTPLAVIATSADLLDLYGKRMTEEQRTERLQQIKVQVKHFTSMLDNISLVVKGISYSMDFAPSPYNLEQTATATIKDLKELLHSTHEVTLELQGDMSELNSDEQLMRLILTHLLANAIKYSPATKPILVTATLTFEKIIVLVKDEGLGILSEDQERIFEPFFRGTNIGEVPGLGIGLSIVKDAVDSMEGSISVQSQPGVGTTVTVQIPLGGLIGIN